MTKIKIVTTGTISRVYITDPDTGNMVELDNIIKYTCEQKANEFMEITITFLGVKGEQVMKFTSMEEQT